MKKILSKVLSSWKSNMYKKIYKLSFQIFLSKLHFNEFIVVLALKILIEIVPGCELVTKSW